MPSGLPLELIREIVLVAIDCHPPRSNLAHTSYKPEWRDVEQLTLVSQAVRNFAIQAWFRVYFTKSCNELLNTDFVCVEVWTRELHIDLLRCTPRQNGKLIWDLQRFKRAHKLRIDLISGPLGHLPPILHGDKVQELDIREEDWPAPNSFTLIASFFPNLRSLKMKLRLVWCHLCNTCNYLFFDEVPPQLIYDGGIGLPMHCARELSRLNSLHKVILAVDAYALGLIRIGPENENLWSGECEACMQIMYADETFRSNWVERKRNYSEILPALSRVEWQFNLVNLVGSHISLPQTL